MVTIVWHFSEPLTCVNYFKLQQSKKQILLLSSFYSEKTETHNRLRSLQKETVRSVFNFLGEEKSLG